MKINPRTTVSTLALGAAILVSACVNADIAETAPDLVLVEEPAAPVETEVAEAKPVITPENWPVVETPPLDPEVEARIDAIMAKMTLEQKVGQTIQADSGSVTPEQVKQYR